MLLIIVGSVDGAAADAHDEMLAYDAAADDEVAAAALLLSQLAPIGNSR